MHHVTRRLSPSLIVAIGALFVALSGTAAAAVIIDSPEQIKDGVVTEPKLANDAVTSTKIRDHAVQQSDQRNPALRARVSSSGTLIRGDVIGIKHVQGSNRYDLEFRAADLGPLGLDNCAFAVSPEFKPISPTETRPLRAYVNHAPGSAAVLQVFTFEERFDPAAQKVRELATEASFDIVLGC
jgi:hypothetical protein